MKEKIKAILLTLVGVMCALALLSCKGDTTDSSSNNGPDAPEAVDDNVVYSPYVKTALVIGDGIDAKNVSIIKSKYYDVVGKELDVSSSSDTVLSHEIIVGKTSRDISAKAYRLLELTDNDNGQVGYVIYSDGKSVALAFDEINFDENVALAEAVETFVELYMQQDTLKLGEGIAYRTRFYPVEKQVERDSKTITMLWNIKLYQIAEKLGGDEATAQRIVDELKQLYDVYTQNSTVEWLANLYDPETGGFYYSNSARNNVGYLPDLESTSQALSIVELILNGYGGTMSDYFGDEIVAKFVSFTNGMQDPNGYFYHPQWDRELVDKNVAKKTRDVVNALSILDFFSAHPKYDTPNNVKGEDAVALVSNITVPLKLSNVSAVSKLVNTQSDEIYIPSYLKTSQNFKNYLYDLKIDTDTLAVLEKIYAEAPLYLAVDEILEEEGADYRLKDILKSYLYNKQNSSSGLWKSKATNTYTAVGYLSSVIKIFNAIGEPVTNYLSILETIVSSIDSIDEVDDITDIVDIWTSFYLVIDNLITYSDEKQVEEVAFVMQHYYSSFDDLIGKTKECVNLFVKKDGSFSTKQKSSLSEISGFPVAIPQMNEGDIAATLNATKKLWASIFGVLQIGSVPIFTTSDRMLFQDELKEMGVIIKNEIKKVEPFDYEGDEVGSIPGNISFKSSHGDSKIEVVKDPLREGNSARLYSTSEKGSDYDYFHFGKMSSVKSASCYVYEFDMCVLPGTSDGLFAQLNFYENVHLISAYKSGNTVYFYECSSRTSSVSRTMDLGVRTQVNEWFNLRVEYYPAPHGEVRIKIFFNGECIVVSDNYFGSQNQNPVPSTNFKNFCIYGYSKANMDVLIDNVVVETTYQIYTAETGHLNRNVDYPEKSQTIHDFEKNNVGDTPAAFRPTGEITGSIVRTDNDGNKLLVLSENIGEIILPLDARGTGINSVLVQFDFTLSQNSKNGAVYQINFNEYKCDKTVFGAMYILVKEENGILYATFADGVSGKIGESYNNVKLPSGETNRISFHLFFEESAIVVAVGDTIVGVNTKVSGIKKGYLGDIKLISETPSISSGFSIDNVIVEKAASSFEEVTAPDIDRVLHGFDDTSNGLEFTGITPTDGMLSFAEVIGIASVKIPVNVRADAPTMALIGFDVFANENDKAGELGIQLSDKAGNVIGTILLYYSNEKTYVYEKTANGRYPTPIYTIKNSKFNFYIEYSESKGRFNIFVDGQCVAATALTHTWDSRDYEFEYLTLSSLGQMGISIDNLYAEKICGIFKSYTAATPNADPVNGVITYETSSFASMPSKIERALGNTTAYHDIKEAKIRGAVSKVLEMNCGDGSGSMVSSAFSRTQTLAGANASFFESDIMVKADNNSALDFRFQLIGTTVVFTVKLTSAGVGQPIYVAGKETNVNEGEWFKLRVEYRDVPDDFNYDGKNDIVARIYVNGDLIAESNSADNVNKVESASVVKKMRVRNYAKPGSMYFDNTIMGQCDIDYVPPVPADTDTLTYEPGVVTKKTQAKFEKTTSKLTISQLTVEGEITKVLDFYSSSGSLDKVTITPTQVEDNANAVMIETDIMISLISDTATLYLDLLTNEGNQPIRLTLTAQKGGDVKLYSISSSGIADPMIPDGVVIGKSGEWLKLKIEYLNPRVDYTGDGVDDILCRIYVNNTLVKTLYQPYKPGAFYDPTLISRLVLSSMSETEANIYLDNTRFWLTGLVADEAPEKAPDVVLGEGEATGDKFDHDGWV